METRVGLVTMFVVLLAVSGARADGPADRGAADPDQHVRRVELDWQALDVGADARPGEARVYTQTLTSADVGSWAEPPPSGFEPVVRTAGGDVGLLPRLSLRLVGAEGTSGVSQMISGLELWLLPRGSAFRLNILGGYQDYQERFARVQSLWRALVFAHDSGPWQFGLSVREKSAFGLGATPDVTAVAGASYTFEPYRVGIEYVTRTSGAAARQALVPSVSTKVANDKVTIKATSTLGVRGVATTPVRVSVAGAF